LFHKSSKENFKKQLEGCIASNDMFEGDIFNIDNKKRKRAMECIFKLKKLDKNYKLDGGYNSKTEETIIERYKDISNYFDNFFDKPEFDEKKLEIFVGYFLMRLVLVELTINKNDTPMVFEVINDRGEALKPFEILKGKLIGILPKTETERYNDFWESSLEKVSGVEDDFFSCFIKSK